jgi:hypothetical protein
MIKRRRTDSTMVKRRTKSTMVKRRRTDNTMIKRRTDNTMAKRGRTDNTMVKRRRTDSYIEPTEHEQSPLTLNPLNTNNHLLH